MVILGVLLVYKTSEEEYLCDVILFYKTYVEEYL